MARWSGLGNRLYTGETSFDIIGRTRTWLVVGATLVLASLLSLLAFRLTLGIEFTGGAEFTAPVSGSSATAQADVREAVVATGIEGAAEPRVTAIGNPERVRVQTGELSADETAQVRDAVAQALGDESDEVTVQLVGPSWGEEITKKALQGLGAFLVAAMIYLSVAFEWRMALSAIVALIHDVLVTVGIYAVVGFDVTPASVIGLLTILGYSLYDTVVVFDKIRENTRGITAQSRFTVSEATNLAINQTLVRSINTSIIALLPVASLLFVGAGLLGAGTLKDLSLALFVGIAVGAFSSIFIAPPLFAALKEREPEMAALRRRVQARRGQADAAGAQQARAAATATGPGADGSGGEATAGDTAVSRRAAPQRTVETGDRRQPTRTTRAQRRGPTRP
jgi:preprotein translocase subunit SecF